MDAARRDESKMRALRGDPRASMLDLNRLEATAEAGQLPWLPLDDQANPNDLALLGELDGSPRFVALDGEGAAHRSFDLMTAIAALSSADAALFATARSLVDWHAHNGFCANCGAATRVERAGWGRACPNCDARHFPRVDPVVIMLAQHGEGADARILVGRQAQFPPNMYSALAGFVEPGETIEEAVARELGEEAGIKVRSVRYIASQPWPFPSQLMIGCIAVVDDDRLEVDRSELEDAIWVDRAEVADALARRDNARFKMPFSIAIAHYLVEVWAGGETS
jgi:NAD+ diphosphatase